MYCQLKYVKHQYISIFKESTKTEIILLAVGSVLICNALINTFSDKTMNYIMIICFLIPFIFFYIRALKYCKEKLK